MGRRVFEGGLKGAAILMIRRPGGSAFSKGFPGIGVRVSFSSYSGTPNQGPRGSGRGIRQPWQSPAGQPFVPPPSTTSAIIVRTQSTSADQKESLWKEFVAGRWPRMLAKESILEGGEFNRWKVVPAAAAIQLSVGSVFAWSMWNGPLTHSLGVVVPSAGDWSMGSVVPIFSTTAVMMGCTTAALGPWMERAGPRLVNTIAAVVFASGSVLCGYGAFTHQLWALYMGYGVVGGIGAGLAYISPISSLIKWFPDRKGVAAGICLSSFGGGAVVASQMIDPLLAFFAKPPTFLGPASEVKLTVGASGAQYALSPGGGGELVEAVVASSLQVERFGGALQEGVYAVGTGSTGAGEAFCTLAALHLSAMVVGSWYFKLPKEGWAPAGWTPPAQAEGSIVSTRSMGHVQAMKTPQFYLMWALICGNSVSGLILISSAKTIMGDVFGAALPMIVTGAFATGYVSAVSLANAGGRLGWALISDYAGRRNLFFLFGLASPLAAAIPSITHWATTTGSTLPLVTFYGSTLLMISFYGGLASLMPAYISDLWGLKHVGAIHGRLMTAWSAAAIMGPSLLAHFRRESYNGACTDLTAKIDPALFESTFGAPATRLQELVDANTVTIARLMDIAPLGTIDPSPLLYDTTMYACSGTLFLAFAANAAMRPVHPQHFDEDAAREKAALEAAAKGAGIDVSSQPESDKSK